MLDVQQDLFFTFLTAFHDTSTVKDHQFQATVIRCQVVLFSFQAIAIFLTTLVILSFDNPSMQNFDRYKHNAYLY